MNFCSILIKRLLPGPGERRSNGKLWFSSTILTCSLPYSSDCAGSVGQGWGPLPATACPSLGLLGLLGVYGSSFQSCPAASVALQGRGSAAQGQPWLPPRLSMPQRMEELVPIVRRTQSIPPARITRGHCLRSGQDLHHLLPMLVPALVAVLTHCDRGWKGRDKALCSLPWEENSILSGCVGRCCRSWGCVGDWAPEDFRLGRRIWISLAVE